MNRYRDMLERILKSYEDGSHEIPDVDAAIEVEIRDLLSTSDGPRFQAPSARKAKSRRAKVARKTNRGIYRG